MTTSQAEDETHQRAASSCITETGEQGKRDGGQNSSCQINAVQTQGQMTDTREQLHFFLLSGGAFFQHTKVGFF